jgi:tetratricopeptide (TPR) repeat protein
LPVFYRQMITSIVALITLVMPVSGQALASKPLTPEQKQKLKERDRFLKESADLEQAGNLSDAIVAARKTLALSREIFGNTDEDVGTLLEFIGRLHVKREDWPAARVACRECVEIAIAVSGKDGWRATNARLALADVDLYAAMTPENRADLRRAERLNAEADRLDGQGKYDEASGLFQEALRIRRQLLGASHRDTLASVNKLANRFHLQRRFATAETLYKQALAGGRKALGDGHPDTFISVNDLASLYRDQGRHAEAEPLFKEALTGKRKALVMPSQVPC